ncbi:MAG TPA: iron-sulfur cluster assembly scaffold protein [Roseiflexaceae bacterium]|nr:iron-sulfur cluster assembly scaffold protein [Roseiflexaceae bacterium]HMP41987.1 iron-sulfur cluster assembly scaffold protein [Roseiflexaceae bacterium]
MDRQEAIEYLLDHYQNPRNSGTLEDADVTMPGGNPGCGDVVTIYLKVDQAHDAIERVTFEGQGCTISQAAASILTELVAERPLSAIEAMDFNDMIDLLGRDVVNSRPRCATLALGTLKAAITKYRTDQAKAAFDGAA